MKKVSVELSKTQTLLLRYAATERARLQEKAEAIFEEAVREILQELPHRPPGDGKVSIEKGPGGQVSFTWEEPLGGLADEAQPPL